MASLLDSDADQFHTGGTSHTLIAEEDIHPAVPYTAAHMYVCDQQGLHSRLYRRYIELLYAHLLLVRLASSMPKVETHTLS